MVQIEIGVAMDYKRLDERAESLAPEPASSHLAAFVGGRSPGREQLEGYKAWVMASYSRHSIRTMTKVLVEEGVELSFDHIRKVVGHWVKVDKEKKIPEGALVAKQPTAMDPKPHAVSEPVSKPSTKKTVASDNSIKQSGASASTWVAEREKQSKVEETNEQALKPFQDSSLSLSERKRLQAEYVRQNADSIFKRN